MKPVAWYREEDGIRMYYDAPYFDDAKPLYSAQKGTNDKISGDGAACVDHDYFWRPIETAPHGVKLQLLSIYGVASHGLLSPAIIEDGFWMGWTPLPKKRKEND